MREVIGIPANRYIFRTAQAIIRRKRRLQAYPGPFNRSTWVLNMVGE